MAKPAITTPVTDEIQVFDKTPANEGTITKQDIIATTEGAPNAVYSSLAVHEPNLAEIDDDAPVVTPPTSTDNWKDLKTVTGYKTTLRGHIYEGTAKS